MSRDPFDLLREQNPMPNHDPIYAPMSAARDIVAEAPRRARPAWVLAGAAALTVLFVGGAWMLWLGNGGDIVPVADSSTSTSVATTAASETTALPVTTTEVTATTTAAPVTTTTTVPGPNALLPDVAVYLFLDDNGTQTAPVPFLVPANRSLAILSHIVEDPVYEALQMLLSGPTPGEAEAVPAISSAIPAGTRLLGVTVEDGIADVDLSAEFVAGGGSLSMLGRLGQVVFTLTRFDEIDAVTFRIEGEPTTVFDGEDFELETPITREGWGDLTPAILIEEPAFWGIGNHPLVVRGTANVFEATVSLTLTDADGLIIWEGFTTATCGTGCRGDFEITIPYEVDEAQLGALIAWEESMEDGRQTNVREHPVWLVPGNGAVTTTTDSDRIGELRTLRGDLDIALDDTLTRLSAAQDTLTTAPDDQVPALQEDLDQMWAEATDLRTRLGAVLDELEALGVQPVITCSAGGLDPVLIVQPDLPDPIADTRRAVYEAALGCNWEALRGLTVAGFTSTFASPTDPIALWQRQELLHYEPMRYLGEILRRPPATIGGGEGELSYMWPSAFAFDSWDQVPDADREALRPLYDDADFASFAQFGGYLGYRVGILETGGWQFFVAGD